MRPHAVRAASALVLAAAGCVSIVQKQDARSVAGAGAVVPAPEAAVDAAPPLPPDELRSTIVRAANAKVGTPYVYGAATPDGLDCSGLVRGVFAECGLTLPRTVFDQFKRGKPRWRSELAPADLVFFETEHRAGATHVGIFVGDGKFVHAPSTGRSVQLSGLAEPYWKDRFLAGRDLIAP